MSAGRGSRAPVPSAGCGEQAGGGSEVELGAELLPEEEAYMEQEDWGG